MAEEFTYKGKELEELKEMTLDELSEIMTAKQRRSLKRGLTDQQKKLLEKVEEAKKEENPRPIKTHARDMIVLPEFVGLTFLVYNGKNFEEVKVEPRMIGHYLGEFVLTRKRVEHGTPGLGATRSSMFIPIK